MAEESLVIREYNEALVQKLEEQNERLQEAQVEIALANQELERRVEDRTAELVALNEELEAFSQSIAHDLRSPLTGINGLSYFLIEECRGKVSQQVMDDLQGIVDAVGRMNELTNDLMRLARVNRAEMSFQQVDLSALSAAIFNDLKAKQGERSIEFEVMPGISATGDVGLLRIALENLLGNAWKYTSKAKNARIGFGVEQQGGRPTFFVSDNGVGFDMASAGKLFSPFCRLHAASEFAGTGIGLSTVKRIMARHGGSIWAESVVGQGATFFFTLGAPARPQEA